MRVAIGVLFVLILGSTGAAGAVSIADQPVAYPTSSAARSAVASQDAFQVRAKNRMSTRNPTNVPTAPTAMTASEDFRLHAGAADYDRRLASLDPSQIVYDQAQPSLTQAGLLDLGNGRLFPRQEPRVTVRQHLRTAEDFMLMGFAALMLIAYQLRKKHRFLRPHPFSY